MTDTKQRALRQELVCFLGKLLLVGMAVTALFTWVFGLCRWEGTEMEPALRSGDLVLFYRLERGYSPGDVVRTSEGKLLRVVAVAGDTVDIREEGLYINGALQQESRIFEKTVRYASPVEFPMTVPEGSVFLLGDKRESAGDSRVFGALPLEEIEGTVVTILRRRGI